MQTLHNDRHDHFKIKICVSGAADMGHLPPEDHQMAKEIGRQIALSGGVLTTGATTGFPFWAAMGAKEAGGMSIGFSPARSEKEHVDVYKLPLDYMDIIIYTGFGYPGRDLFLTRASDAVIEGPGRIGTFHEFTIAYEDEKPTGVLTSDDWKTDDIIKEILENSHRDASNVIFDSDPKRLVERLIDMVKKKKVNDSSEGDPFRPPNLQNIR